MSTEDSNPFPLPLSISQTMDETGQPLTSPSEPRSNQGWDNEYNDLIVCKHDVLLNRLTNGSYLVVGKLGQGTFGQVVHCFSDHHQKFVAVKIIKNQPAYHQQSLVEVKILQSLGRDYDPDRHNFVRLLDHFVFKHHLCLVFELLQRNLYELIKVSQYRGFSLSLVKHFIKQVLQALRVLRQERIIHGDLKPENILMEDDRTGLVKVIDFGSACMEHETFYSYIQSRFYRSPEIVLAYPYDSAIDMWSLGCIAAELYLGLPLFPAASEWDLLARMIEILGPFPSEMLASSRKVHRYFRTSEDVGFGLLSQEEFEHRNHEAAPTARRYFDHSSLRDIIQNSRSPSDGTLSEDRGCFLDFLLGLLKIDPQKRWNAEQAAMHPFITGASFEEPFQPVPSGSRTASRPVRIGPFAEARYHSASWHPQVNSDAHSIAHHAAMMAVSQLTSSVTSHSSQLAAGPGSFVQMMGSVPHGIDAGSVEANPIVIAAMTAALREAFSNPSCPSILQTTRQSATSPGHRRIHGFNVATHSSSTSTDTTLTLNQGPGPGSGPSFNTNRHARPMAGINENGPPYDEGRVASFDQGSNLSYALESCHVVQPPNRTSLEPNKNLSANSIDAGHQFQLVGGPSHGIAPFGPPQFGSPFTAGQFMAASAEMHEVSAAGSSISSRWQGAPSAESSAERRLFVERPVRGQDSQSSYQGFSVESSFEMGLSEGSLSTVHPRPRPTTLAEARLQSPTDGGPPESPQDLFLEEFLEGG